MENIKLLGEWDNVPSVILPTQDDGLAEFIAKSNLLKYGVLRPDAELANVWSEDYLLVSGKHVTLPAYPSALTTILASEDLTPTYTVDYTNYNWYILERMLTIPTYSISSKAKGREEYHCSSYLYELSEIPANTFAAIVDTSKKYTSNSRSLVGVGLIRQLYWSSASAVSVYTGTGYGITQAITAPALSSGVITAKSPIVQVRGSSTYLSQTYYDAITDLRCQYRIELYRAPKNNLNLDGWGLAQQLLHIVNDVNNNNKILT